MASNVAFHFIVVLILAIHVAEALKCHMISYGNLTDPNAITTSLSLQECPIGANSCVKTVDYMRGVFSKQCQIGNCTSQTGITQSPASCFNNTNAGASMATCCCYGDGCNSGTSQSTIVSIIGSIVASFFIFS